MDIKNLFSDDCLCDKKHKLNTTNKVIPQSILKVINKGITIERLNDLASKGFDIYKYQTQITIHGICKELTNNRVNYYQSLTLNNNGSIGVRWIAIDNEKKQKICNTLRYFGWSKRETSNELYPFMMERFTNLNDAISKCNEYKKIAERIDKNLFFGRYNISIGSYMGLYYSIFDLFINGILERNVNKVIEQITGMNITDVNEHIDRINKEREERRKQYKRENEERKNKANEYNERFMNFLNKEYKETNSLSLSDGDVFYALRTNFEGRYKLVGYTFGKRTCKPLLWNECNNQKYCKKNCKVYIKINNH